MPLSAAVVFAPLHFEHANFVAPAMAEHGGGNRRRRGGRTQRNAFALRHHQHPPEFHRCAFGDGQFFDFKPVADRDLVLLAASFDYCIHWIIRQCRASRRSAPGEMVKTGDCSPAAAPSQSKNQLRACRMLGRMLARFAAAGTARKSCRARFDPASRLQYPPGHPIHPTAIPSYQ